MSADVTLEASDEEILLYFKITGEGLDAQTFANSLLAFDELYRAIANLLRFVCSTVLVGFFVNYRVTVRAKQRALNEVLSEVATNEKHVLFLRPFRSATRYPLRSTLRGWGERMLCGARWDVETALSFAFQGTALLFAIGEKAESVGAIKLYVADPIWKDRFEQLCNSAELIFVLPLCSPSTMWEIDRIMSNDAWKAKALFIMPPMISVWQYIKGLFGKSPRYAWERARLELKSISLPLYSRRGCIFTVAANGRVDEFIPLAVLHRDFSPEIIRTRGRVSSVEPKRIWFDRIPWRWTVAAPNFGYVVAILMLLGSTFPLFFRPFNVPSGSMKPTLLVGDYLNANTLAYGIDVLQDVPLVDQPFRVLQTEPTRGDLVFFRLPKDPDTIFVKRLIGLSGDRVQMREGLLYINDTPVKRERLSDFIGEDPCGSDSTAGVKRWKETLPNGVTYETLDCVDDGFYDNTNVYTVPAGHFFMMGDNRDNSTDSRILSAVGYVPLENFVGRAQMIYFSIAEGEHAWMLWRWPTAVRWNRLFTILR